MDLDPSRSKKGNTKLLGVRQISPAKGWCFTFNNYNDSEVDPILSIFEQKADKAIIGKEIGESGTPHLQGFVKFKTKLRPKSLGLSKKIHWEKQRGSIADNINYCSKEECFYVKGIRKPYRPLLKNLYEWQKEILEILKKEPDDRTIYWYWSEEGSIGKSKFVKHVICVHSKDIIVLGQANADSKCAICLYKLKHAQTPRILIFDIPRATTIRKRLYETLEECKNMCFFSPKYESQMLMGENPHIIVFANKEPDYDMLSSDRLVVRKID